VSEFADIEGAMVTLIEEIEDGGAGVFATVQGWASAGRNATLAALERLVKPAALVMVERREQSVASEAVPGDPQVGVVVAGSNLRSPEAARLGAADGHGAYELASKVTAVLDGAILADVRRLRSISEQIIAADERTVVIEQRWLAERPAELSAPTYGGETIAGSEAVVSVHVNSGRASAVEFGFPGVDGVYRHTVGMRERTIRWSGQLRATSHSSLIALETTIEGLVEAGRADTVADSIGRTYVGCVALEFRRDGPRRIHPLRGTVSQNFQLDFVQVAG